MFGRSLGGTDCLSSVGVTCTIKNTGLPCENNLRVRRSDCVANDGRIAVPVTIEWKYCNNDVVVQVPDPNLLIPKFKKAVKVDPNSSKNLPGGQCRVLRSQKSINVCKAGATMSMKYEGTVPSRPNSYCYSYGFLRVKKKWLSETECAVSTNVQCIMATGAKVGEKCTGNIIRNADCEQVPVTFKYSTCLWNINADNVMTFDRQQSWIKIGGDKVTPSYDRTPLAPETQCRVTTRDVNIDTCVAKTVTSLQMAGSLTTSGTECSSYTSLKVRPASLCDFKFILTELVHNDNGATYVEIFSKDCPNQIVTEDFHIVKYRGNNRKPSLSGPINLHGIRTDNGGFATFCLSFNVNSEFGADSCRRVTGPQTAAHLNGSDRVAIIQGDPSSDFQILDIYGTPGVALSEEYTYLNSRAVRSINIEEQRGTWVSSEWSKETFDSATPRNWGNYGVFRSNNGSNDGDNKDKNKNDNKDKSDKNKNSDKDKDDKSDKDKKDDSDKNDKNKNNDNSDKDKDDKSDKDNDKNKGNDNTTPGNGTNKDKDGSKKDNGTANKNTGNNDSDNDNKKDKSSKNNTTGNGNINTGNSKNDDQKKDKDNKTDKSSKNNTDDANKQKGNGDDNGQKKTGNDNNSDKKSDKNSNSNQKGKKEENSKDY